MVMQIIISKLKHSRNLFWFFDLAGLTQTYFSQAASVQALTLTLTRTPVKYYTLGLQTWLQGSSCDGRWKAQLTGWNTEQFPAQAATAEESAVVGKGKKKKKKTTNIVYNMLATQVHGGGGILYRTGVTTHLFPTSQHVNTPAGVLSSPPPVARLLWPKPAPLGTSTRGGRFKTEGPSESRFSPNSG